MAATRTEWTQLEALLADGKVDEALLGFKALLAVRPSDSQLQKRVEMLERLIHSGSWPAIPKGKVADEDDERVEAHIRAGRLDDALDLLERSAQKRPRDPAPAERPATRIKTPAPMALPLPPPPVREFSEPRLLPVDDPSELPNPGLLDDDFDPQPIPDPEVDVKPAPTTVVALPRQAPPVAQETDRLVQVDVPVQAREPVDAPDVDGPSSPTTDPDTTTRGEPVDAHTTSLDEDGFEDITDATERTAVTAPVPVEAAHRVPHARGVRKSEQREKVEDPPERLEFTEKISWDTLSRTVLPGAPSVSPPPGKRAQRLAAPTLPAETNRTPARGSATQGEAVPSSPTRTRSLGGVRASDSQPVARVPVRASSSRDPQTRQGHDSNSRSPGAIRISATRKPAITDVEAETSRGPPVEAATQVSPVHVPDCTEVSLHPALGTTLVEEHLPDEENGAEPTQVAVVMRQSVLATHGPDGTRRDLRPSARELGLTGPGGTIVGAHPAESDSRSSRRKR